MEIAKKFSDSIDDVLDDWFNSSESKLQELHTAAFAFFDIGIEYRLVFET